MTLFLAVESLDLQTACGDSDFVVTSLFSFMIRHISSCFYVLLLGFYKNVTSKQLCYLNGNKIGSSYVLKFVCLLSRISHDSWPFLYEALNYITRPNISAVL